MSSASRVVGAAQIRQFQEQVWEYFRLHRRQMPWRNDPTPYHVLVSEIMLQQTQVIRVIPKYEQFMQYFPTLQDLAETSLAAVLRAWNGLGYNRRAKFLHAAAQKVQTQYGGRLPAVHSELVRLPGIGPNTAGAILAYAYNLPAVFVETNIRTVFFHHFFAGRSDIDDRDLLPLVEQTCDREQPREWYWALMDYGAHLKQTLESNISSSRHYVRQSAFEGSKRQLRGWLIRELLAGPVNHAVLIARHTDARLPTVITELIADGLIEHHNAQLKLTGQVKLP